MTLEQPTKDQQDQAAPFLRGGPAEAELYKKSQNREKALENFSPMTQEVSGTFNYDEESMVFRFEFRGNKLTGRVTPTGQIEFNTLDGDVLNPTQAKRLEDRFNSVVAALVGFAKHEHAARRFVMDDKIEALLKD